MPRMIDGDALLEKMKHRREYIRRPSDPVCLVEDAPTVGGWISVKDRLPDKNGKYLVATKGIVSYIETAWFLENLRDNPQFEYEDVPDVPGFFKGDNEGDWIVSDVTHWMSLPEPPKEDGDAG